jgi:hypothetical protein
MGFLFSLVDITKIVPLGFYWVNTGLSGINVPVQAVFCKTKVEYDLDDLKRLLKDKHDYTQEPIIGPPLHHNEPALRTVDEVKARMHEIVDFPEKTATEAYLNDLYSQIGINQLFLYIDKNGVPF